MFILQTKIVDDDSTGLTASFDQSDGSLSECSDSEEECLEEPSFELVPQKLEEPKIL